MQNSRKIPSGTLCNYDITVSVFEDGSVSLSQGRIISDKTDVISFSKKQFEELINPVPEQYVPATKEEALKFLYAVSRRLRERASKRVRESGKIDGIDSALYIMNALCTLVDLA